MKNVIYGNTTTGQSVVFRVDQAGNQRITVPSATSVTVLNLTTAATGTNWTAFSSQVCGALDIVNNTGVTIEYRRNATGVAMQIPNGAARMVIGITNANQIDVRRTDTANSQVTVQAEAIV
jgi:hypothetical protein